MKYLLYLSTAMTLCLSMISCDKDRNYTIIEGTVLEYGSLKPVENAAVEIYQRYSKGLFQGVVQWAIDTIYTNENGYFKFKTDIDPHNDEYNTPGAFGISQIWHEKYFPENSIFGVIVDVYHLDKVKEEVQMDPYAWLSVNAINSEAYAGNFCEFWLKNSNSNFSVYEDDYSDVYTVKGNTKIYTRVRREPQSSEVEIDSFYISAFDTIQYIIEF